MKQADAFPFVVYLLHFAEPVGKARHYLGITWANRLRRRLSEHARGVGSSLTAEVAKRGSTFTLVALFPAATRDEERRWKRAGHYVARCPICKGNMPPPACELFNPVPRPPSPDVIFNHLDFEP